MAMSSAGASTVPTVRGLSGSNLLTASTFVSDFAAHFVHRSGVRGVNDGTGVSTEA